jgi:hypothetical protein
LFKLPVPLRLTQLLQLIALLSLRGLDLIELPLLCFVRRIRKSCFLAKKKNQVMRHRPVVPVIFFLFEADLLLQVRTAF